MGIRYYFKNEVVARQAINDLHNLGYWAASFRSGLPSGASLGVECSELAEGICESRYGSDLV